MVNFSSIANNASVRVWMVCLGDSGGPLLQLDYVNGDYRQGKPSSDLVVGVTSFGERLPGSAPGVYTSIGAFAQWIDDVTKGNVVRQKTCFYSLIYL